MVGIRFPLGRIARRGVPFGSGANMDALNVRDKHLPQAAQRLFSMAETHPLVPVLPKFESYQAASSLLEERHPALGRERVELAVLDRPGLRIGSILRPRESWVAQYPSNCGA